MGRPSARTARWTPLRRPRCRSRTETAWRSTRPRPSCWPDSATQSTRRASADGGRNMTPLGGAGSIATAAAARSCPSKPLDDETAERVADHDRLRAEPSDRARRSDRRCRRSRGRRRARGGSAFPRSSPRRRASPVHSAHSRPRGRGRPRDPTSRRLARGRGRKLPGCRLNSSARRVSHKEWRKSQSRSAARLAVATHTDVSAAP